MDADARTTHIVVRGMTLAAALLVVARAVWAQTGRRKGAADPQARFKQLDGDKDGKVSRKEAGDAWWFDRLDRNRDGFITPDELPAGRTGRGAGAARNATVPENVVVRRDIAYGKHTDQRLDLYAPKDARRAPVMVYVHGGGWRKGDKSAVGRKVAYFTGRGWLLVSVNYRLLPAGRHPVNVQDVARALAWVHDHAAARGGNPGEIFLMGHSAGAHLVALVATDARPLQAAGKKLSILKGVIPLDTNAYDVTAVMKSPAAAGLYGQVFGNDPDVWRDASPVQHVAAGKGIPPMLICYSSGMGRRANPMRAERANAFAKALKAAGVRAEVVDASDRNHGQINQRFGDPKDQKVTGRAMAFLDSLRSGKSPTTAPTPK